MWWLVVHAELGAQPCWSAGLSRALCLIHKQQGTAGATAARTEASKPRILCVNGSPDVPAQYIATMNAIFSAQVHTLLGIWLNFRLGFRALSMQRTPLAWNL